VVRSGAVFMDDYLARLAQPSAMQLARQGDFRAIAYWLNASLVPHGIYARVAEDRPGMLLVLLEFFRLPRRDRLNHLVCHRLCRLHSPLIQGVRILARFANQTEILWDNSIRLVFAGQARSVAAAPRRRARPRPRKRLKAAIAPVAALPAAEPTKRRPLRRRKPTTTARHAVARSSRSHHSAVGRSPNPRRPATKPSARFRPTPNQLKLLSSSAAAMFLLGCGIELWKQADVGVLLQDWQQGRTSIRTPLGRIPVINAASDSSNPTVTLTFTGGSALHAANASTADEATNASSDLDNPDNTDNTDNTDNPDNPGNPDNTVASDAAETVEPFTMPLQERPLPEADVALANLSQPISREGSAAAQRVESTQNAQISLVNVSNQPASGADEAALRDTLEILQQSGMHAVGAGRNSREARQPEIVEVRGKRIAYLGYADGRSPAASDPDAASALQERVAQDIEAIRGKVDWVIVNYHWTQDIASYPEPWQMELARSAIDQGADLVVGYHPNVLQGAEIYRGRAIAYSLGNFIFAEQAQSARSNYDSAVLKVSLNNDRMRLEFLPVEVQGQQAAIATGKRAEEIRTYLTQASALFEQPLQSPIILDRLALDPNQPVTPESFDGEPTAEPTVKPTDSESFITHPEGDPSPDVPEVDSEQPFTTPSFTAPGNSAQPDKAVPKPVPPESVQPEMNEQEINGNEINGSGNNSGWNERQPSANPAAEEGFITEPSEMDDAITKPQSSQPSPDRPDEVKTDETSSDAFTSDASTVSGSGEARWLPDAENGGESDTVPEEADKSLNAAL